MSWIGYAAHVTIDAIGMALIKFGLTIALIGEALICDELRAEIHGKTEKA